MVWQRKDEKANQIYLDYQTGLSLSGVAKKYECTRQSVFEMFKNRGFELRRKPEPLPFVIFNGCKYTLRNHGYYGKTTGKRTLLHRDIWEHFKGEIPEWFDIHHKDENKAHNDISNFECLPKTEHTRLYSPHNNQHTAGRRKVRCGA